jgi:hypothetical protein
MVLERVRRWWQVQPQRSLRPYRPASEPRLARLAASHAARSPAAVWREPGRGALATVVLGGFVPDSTEAVHCQRRLLRRFGPTYYLNYDRAGFDGETLQAQLRDLLEDLARRGERPVLLGVSFGCALIIELLARLARDGGEDAVAGAVLVSPVLSLEDLTGDGGATLVGRIAAPAAAARSPAELAAALRNARRCFGRMFAAGGRNRQAMAALAWRGQGEFLRRRITATLAGISDRGGVERLAHLPALCPLGRRAGATPLTRRPVVVVYAEDETAVVAAGAPGRRALETDSERHFPAASTIVASAGGGPPVQHASLIFHHSVYNRILAGFYRRLGRERPRRAWPLVRRRAAPASCESAA